ncbi:unnamed protein product [Caenorhabditis brenneri]
MKVQRLIRILYCLLIIGFSNGESLKPEENNERLDRCGKFDKKDLKHIIRWSQNKNKTELVRTAALISSRHILLSSSVVLEGKNWIYSGQGFDEKVCANKKNGYIDVPQEALEDLGLGWQTKLTRAIIICNQDLFQYVKESWMSFPMILETKERLGNHNPFCLPGERYKLLKKAYGFYQYIVNKFVEEKLNVRGTEYPGFIDTDTYTIDTDGMLVDKKDGTLVGIGVTPGDDTHKGGFLNIILLAKDLCKLFGICENRMIIPLPPAPLSSAGKLTATENVKSKIKCGNESNSAFGYVTNGKTHSMMTMISPRHFLTMTNIIFDLVAWKPERCQGGGNQFFQLPPTVFDTLKFSWPKTTKVEKVFVVCDGFSFFLHETYGLPMIIEVQPNVDGDKPCLPSDKTLLKPNETLQIYQYYEPFALPAEMKFKEEQRPYLYVYKEATPEPGSPLFFKQGKDWTIVGVSTGVNNAFFSVQWMLKEICDLAGICKLDEATTVPPKVPIVTKPPAVAVTTKALTVKVPPPRPKPEAPTTKKPKPTTVPPKPAPPKPTIAPVPPNPTVAPSKPIKPATPPPKPAPPVASSSKKPITPPHEPSTTPKAKEPITDSLNSTTESSTPQQFDNSTTIGITDPLNSDNSTTPSTFEPSTPEESPEPTLEPIATIDLNEEYEEWKERDKIENMILDDEWGNDFYRSADFFSSGRRSELFAGFLIMVTQLLLLIFYLVTGSLNGKPLDEKENDDRVERCGDFSGPYLGSRITFAGRDPSRATTLISKRHILVSSKLVLDNEIWIRTNEKFDKALCDKETNAHVVAPEGATENLIFGWSGCDHNLKNCKKDIKITKAVIICNKRILERLTFPMIMETETSVEFPTVSYCLAREGYNLAVGKSVVIDGFHETGPGGRDQLTMIGKDSDYLHTSPFESYTDGLLINDQGTLIGLSVDGGDPRSIPQQATKFLDIRLFAEDFCVLFGICQHSKSLTSDQNADRLKICGTKPYSKNNYNIRWVQSTVTNTLVFISPRHVLTSAELVLYATVTEIIWRHNKQMFESKKCDKDENVHIRVPPDALKNFQSDWGDLKISRGFIICNRFTVNYAFETYFPLILEVTPPSDPITSFCLSDGETSPVLDDPLTFYEYYTKNNSLLLHDLKFVYKNSAFIKAGKYTSFDSKGGALVDVRNKDKQVLVGSGAHGGNNGIAFFFDIRRIINDLCYLIGICPMPKPPPIPTPALTTEEPTTVPSPPFPTTEAPTTEKVTTEESTSEKPTSSKVPGKSTESPESTMAPESSTPEKSPPLETMEPIPVIDLDEEFREFQERQEKEDRGDWDEWGNDFYRSADFFSSGRRSELFVGFLMVIIVV